MEEYTVYQVNSSNVILYNSQQHQSFITVSFLDVRAVSQIQPGSKLYHYEGYGFVDQEWYRVLWTQQSKTVSDETLRLFYFLGKYFDLPVSLLSQHPTLLQFLQSAKTKSISESSLPNFTYLIPEISTFLREFGTSMQGKYGNLDYQTVNLEIHCLASLFSVVLIEIDEKLEEIRHYPDSEMTKIQGLYYSKGVQNVLKAENMFFNAFPRTNIGLQRALEGISHSICPKCGLKRHFSLPCGHKICENCFILPTESYLICSFDFNVYNLLDVIPEELKEILPKSSICSTCNSSGEEISSLENLTANRVFRLNCGDSLCLFCAQQFLIAKKQNCEICGLLNPLKITTFPPFLCWKCGDLKKITEFSRVFCERKGEISPHRICDLCVSTSFFGVNCLFCGRNYAENELSEFAKTLKCEKCGKMMEKRDIFAVGVKNCGCLTCTKCANMRIFHKIDITGCGKDACRFKPSLSIQISRSIRSFYSLNVMDESDKPCENSLVEYKNQRKERQIRRKVCEICDEPFFEYIKAREIGFCGHIFHAECLGGYFEEEMKAIIGRNRDEKHTELVVCPIRGCKGQVYESLLSGRFAVVKGEIYDEYNVFQADKQFLIMSCDCCADRFAIQKEDKFFRCPMGNEHCVVCKGLGNEGSHDMMACQYVLKEEKRLDFFPEPCEHCGNTGCADCPVAQCPGCMDPCEKIGCDDVVCKSCQLGFCFGCSVPLAVIQAHKKEKSSLWHRPQCIRYPVIIPEEERRGIVDREEMKQDCPQCVKLGRRCDPPGNLQIPHRFSLEEWRNQS